MISWLSVHTSALFMKIILPYFAHQQLTFRRNVGRSPSPWRRTLKARFWKQSEPRKKKKKTLLSIEDWLFNMDPYNGS